MNFPYLEYIFNGDIFTQICVFPVCCTRGVTWQWQQYQYLEKNLPEKAVLTCCDFGENVEVLNQDEAQGAHWSNIQVTIHPIVAKYRCQADACNQLVTDTMMFLSDDNKHCADAVCSLHVRRLGYQFCYRPAAGGR